jgi:hypothetical protein
VEAEGLEGKTAAMSDAPMARDAVAALPKKIDAA